MIEYRIEIHSTKHGWDYSFIHQIGNIWQNIRTNFAINKFSFALIWLFKKGFSIVNFLQSGLSIKIVKKDEKIFKFYFQCTDHLSQILEEWLYPNKMGKCNNNDIEVLSNLVVTVSHSVRYFSITALSWSWTLSPLKWQALLKSSKDNFSGPPYEMNTLLQGCQSQIS